MRTHNLKIRFVQMKIGRLKQFVNLTGLRGITFQIIFDCVRGRPDQHDAHNNGTAMFGWMKHESLELKLPRYVGMYHIYP
jgi:hypothetical protein